MAKSTRVTSEFLAPCNGYQRLDMPKKQTNASLIASQLKTIPIKPPAKKVVLLKNKSSYQGGLLSEAAAVQARSYTPDMLGKMQQSWQLDQANKFEHICHAFSHPTRSKIPRYRDLIWPLKHLPGQDKRLAQLSKP